MPAIFDRLGISFQYPENWLLEESSAIADAHTVSLESPGGGFWSVTFWPLPVDPKYVAEEALSAMKEDYDDLEFVPIEEAVAGFPLLGFDLNFVYLDMTSTSCIRAANTPAGTYLLQYQAEDREFEEVGPVFQAMIVSLLQGNSGRSLPEGE